MQHDIQISTNGNPFAGLEQNPLGHVPINRETPRVCLVDDDPSVLKAMARLIVSAGWEVESFSDPQAFLAHAEKQPPPLVVLDILMPLMNGLEVQRRLKEISPSTRVIILTSNDDSFVQDRAMEAGASAFFVKPVNDDDFLAGIESAISTNGG